MRNTLCFAVLIISSLSIVPGCHKAIEYIPGGPGKGSGGEFVRIKTFIPATTTSPEIHTIKYNKAGNPVSVVGRKNQSITFKYDKSNRLTEYTYHFVDTIIDYEIRREEWNTHHQYYYESNKVVKDSLRYDFVLTSPSTNFVLATRKESRLYYDSEGRIIEDRFDLASTVQGGTEFVDGIDFYHYDSNGNLISPIQGETLVYDHKINYLRTHPLWMFITRNYSVNNVVGAISYNFLGLPEGFRDLAGQGSRQNLFREIILTQGERPLAITYERVK